MTSRQAKSLCEYMLPHKIGVISYGATFSVDNNQFPNFLRTIPSDQEESVAIISLLEVFNWTLVTPIFSSDIYGLSGKESISNVALTKNILLPCMSVVPLNLNSPMNNIDFSRIKTIVDCIKSVPDLKVVLLYMDTLQAISVLKTFYDLNAFGLQFIFADAASEAIFESSSFASQMFPVSYLFGKFDNLFIIGTKQDHLNLGSIGVVPFIRNSSKFNTFFSELTPETTNISRFIDFWEASFKCFYFGAFNPIPENAILIPECTSDVSLRTFPISCRCTGNESLKHMPISV